MAMRHQSPGSRPSHRNDRFERASAFWDRGELSQALRLFLEAARDGDQSCQLNVGYFFDEGLGVRRSSEKALYWYRRAYRSGSASAANNIGLILRKEKRSKAALQWFLRALRRGDRDSALHVAEFYLTKRGGLSHAVRYLRLAMSARSTEATRERATKLLRQIVRERQSGQQAFEE